MKTYTDEELEKALAEPIDVLAMVPVCKAMRNWDWFSEGPSGYCYTNINGQALKNRLTKIFGVSGWDFVVEEKVVSGEGNKWAAETFGSLVLRWKNGEQEIEKRIASVGSESGKDSGADAFKSAKTEAIKKAASEIGIASEIYEGGVDYPEWRRRLAEIGIHTRQQFNWVRSGRKLQEPPPQQTQPAQPRQDAASPKQIQADLKPASAPKVPLESIARELKLNRQTVMELIQQTWPDKGWNLETLPENMRKTLVAVMVHHVAQVQGKWNDTLQWLGSKGHEKLSEYLREVSADKLEGIVREFLGVL